MGTVGFPGTLGAPGFAATGGPGLGFAATGGGDLAVPVNGPRVWAEFEDVSDVDVEFGFFHGAVEPLEGAMPGKTDTGLADASAATEVALIACVGIEVAALGGLRAAGGGGGGGTGAALGLGGMSSR